MSSNGTTHEKRYRLTIVGGGLAATKMLHALVGNVRQRRQHIPLCIEIIESGDTVFHGLAWDPKNVRPFHLTNQYAEQDFYEPLQVFVNEVRSLGGDVSSMIGGNPELYEVNRGLYGEFNRAAAFLDVHRLKTMGVPVECKTGMEVQSIKRDGDGYSVTSKDKAGNTHISHADYVQLATGHWQKKSKDKVQEQPGYFPSPWPASALETIPSNQEIAVLGSGLSGVDAVLTLAHKAGCFERDASNHLRFIPNDAAKNFKIQIYSSHGMLPDVMGFIPNEKLEFRGLRGDSLDKLFSKLQRYYAETVKTKPDLPINTLFTHGGTLEESVAAAYAHYQRLGATACLRTQVETSKQSLAAQEAVPHQLFTMFYSTLLEKALFNVSAEDAERFEHHLLGIYSKHTASMVMTNAEQMLALLEAGCMEVHALGDTSWVGKTKGKSGAEIAYVDAEGNQHSKHFSAVVDARGDRKMALRFSSPLMQQLFDDQLLILSAREYENQRIGAAQYHQERSHPYEFPTVMVTPKGRYVRPTGYIALEDPGVARAGDGKKSRLFPVGQILSPLTPLVIGEHVVREYTAAHAKTICDEVIQLHQHDVANAATQNGHASANGQPKKWYWYTSTDAEGRSVENVMCIVPPETPEKRKEGMVRGIAASLGIPPSRVSCLESTFVTQAMLSQLKAPSSPSLSFS